MSQAGGQRIRVLEIITRLNIGGAALQAMVLAERLAPERYETALVAGRPGPSEGDMRDLRPPTIRPIIVPELTREISPVADVLALRRLIAIVRRYRPQVVHTHMSKAGLLGRLAARTCGVPVVVHTFHGNVLRAYFDPVRTRVFLMLERALARISTRIIAISPRQRDEIRRLGIAREPKLVEIPLGVELARFLEVPRGVLRAEFGIPDDVPLVGVVGRLVAIKRIDLFIEAVAVVRRSIPHLQGVIVGDGYMRPQLERLVRERGLESAVRFIGWRADLRPVYGDLDVLVLSSDNEGTPVSVLEALAARRPVVATAVGGVPDVLGRDRGVLVSPGDAAAISKAIIGVIERPQDAAQRAEAGRSHVYPSYDVAALVARTDDLYMDAVHG